MSLVLTEASILKEGKSRETHDQRHLLSTIVWFVVLTFPIWIDWLGLLMTHAPIEVYLIFIPLSYYAIIVYAPYIGIPWLLVVTCMVIYRVIGWFRKRRMPRLTRGTKKERTKAEDSRAA
jgi:hypothetical protein